MGASQDVNPVALQCPQCGAPLPVTSEGYTVCQYCGASLIYRGREAASDGAAEALTRGVRLKTCLVRDEQGTGLEVFRMLIPVGWQSSGGCRWLLDNPSMPAVVSFWVWNPQGGEAFEILPNINLTWSGHPAVRAMRPTGSRYFGAEVRPPMGIEAALRELVLPRYRSKVGQLQLLSYEPQPHLPEWVRSEALVFPGGSAEGGKVRIRYRLRDWPLDEEIYGVVEVFRTPAVSMFGPIEVVTWFVDYLFGFRAAADQLDATADLFATMVGSFRLNPQWYAASKAVIQYLAAQQIQRIRHVGEIGNIVARTGREVREQNLRDWYARQEAHDQRATNWSRAMLGVDAYFDPHQQAEVELPSGYGHAWANALGEYIVTDDASFNPNLHSSQQWEPMEQR